MNSEVEKPLKTKLWEMTKWEKLCGSREND